MEQIALAFVKTTAIAAGLASFSYVSCMLPVFHDDKRRLYLWGSITLILIAAFVLSCGWYWIAEAVAGN